MESVLSKACVLKINEFEGPLDLLFHLVEKNKMDIKDVSLSFIADQYMDYLYAMKEMDMEIAGEFLLLAATLLQIKTKSLLPGPKESEDEASEQESFILLALEEYKNYKNFSYTLKEWEKDNFGKLSKLPEIQKSEIVYEYVFEKDAFLKAAAQISKRKKWKTESPAIITILKRELFSVKSKIREIIRLLAVRKSFKFFSLFSPSERPKEEVIAGFLAVLELSKEKKVKISQKTHFSDIFIYKRE